MIFCKVAPARGRIKRRQQPSDRFLLVCRPFGPHADDLFGCGRPQILLGGNDPADTAFGGDDIPRRSNAETVNRSRSERIRCQRRRHDHKLDIVVGVNAASGKPVAKFVIMRGKRVGHAKRRWRLAAGTHIIKHTLQRLSIFERSRRFEKSGHGLHAVKQAGRKRDRIAAASE